MKQAKRANHTYLSSLRDEFGVAVSPAVDSNFVGTSTKQTTNVVERADTPTYAERDTDALLYALLHDMDQAVAVEKRRDKVDVHDLIDTLVKVFLRHIRRGANHAESLPASGRAGPTNVSVWAQGIR